jgi:hypothetical protein
VAQKTNEEGKAPKAAKAKVADKSQPSKRETKAAPKTGTKKSQEPAAKKIEGLTKTKTPSKVTAAIGKKPTQKKTATKTAPRRKPVSFGLDAPYAQQVFLVGCFNDWNPFATPLSRNDEGRWVCTIDVEPGEHQYRFFVDDQWWDDPCNSYRCCNEFGTENCIVIVEE